MIAVNTSWERVPFADVLYACDMDWWNGTSGQKALKEFKGEKWTQCPDAAKQYGLNWIESRTGQGIGNGFVYTGGGNSGYQALNLAMQWGVVDVILCGFTMAAVEDTQVHWHMDHTGNNPVMNQLQEWGRILGEMERYAPGKIRIHGKSSVTAFPLVDLVPKDRD